MKRLNGKTAVITGGATGIGRAAAKRFIEEGAFVFIFGRRQEALEAAVADLGPNARAVKGSVSDPADLDRLYATVKAERGSLDIVFANAGAGSQLPLGKITAEHIAVLPALRASKAGAIVNISSAAATMPFGPFAHYGAAKAALEYYSRTLAVELAPSGIRVNVVSPGVISTPGSDEFARTTPGISSDAWLQHIPMGRIGATEDIAEVVALLVSDRGKFLTGVNYRADGGMTAR